MQLTGIIIAIAVVVFLFVPFSPFRIAKRLIFRLLNDYAPFPIKFSDIGGIPILGMRLFNVKIVVQGGNTIEADELRIGVKPWRWLMRRPVLDPLTLYGLKISIAQDKSRGMLWFLLPVVVVSKFIGLIFSNIMGPSVVRIRQGQITVRGKKPGYDTVVEDINGLFEFRGATTAAEYMTCRIGDGTIEIRQKSKRPLLLHDVKISNLDIVHLRALKVPPTLTGNLHINGVMRGSLADSKFDGQAHSACLFMQDEPIRNFTSPLKVRGGVMMFTAMHGLIGDMDVRGALSADFQTDITHLKLEGGGVGEGAGSIFKMLKMKPYIDRCKLDARVDIDGDFEKFPTISGDIIVHMTDVEVNPEAFNAKRTPGKPFIEIPKVNLNFFMQDSGLFSERSTAEWLDAKIDANGHINMKYDSETERVVATTFDVWVHTEDNPGAARQTGIQLPEIQRGHVRIETFSPVQDAPLTGEGKLDLVGVRLRAALPDAPNALSDLLSIEFAKVTGGIGFQDLKVHLRRLHFETHFADFDLNGFIGYDSAVHLDGKLLLTKENERDGSPVRKISSMILKDRHLHCAIGGVLKNPTFQLKIQKNDISDFSGRLAHSR